jgi:uncharacterized MAPEG superfamily protein
MNVNRRKQPQERRLPRRENSGARQRQNGSAGNAHQKYERYIALAREATLSGDTVEAENFYQHAEHYFRVMRERAP